MSVLDPKDSRSSESIELTTSQETVLQELARQYHQHGEPVKGKEIGERIGRCAGTVRNQMQSLKRLDLVDGVPGPNGGYEPTAKVLEILGMESPEQGTTVPVFRNGDPVEDASVIRIGMSTVYHPTTCRAELQVTGGVETFDQGDRITIGPMPVSGLRLTGTFSGTDSTGTKLMVTVEEMETG
ncbi:TrmB family transcriptional regulator [Natranaeroarchaeum aerophilus]|uniref:TrmB family transcriptional regulator n=1 Tax=Natranaeroarchaeum aerophilus TaxID=2917711 RepID=A0AAE3K5U5_9EURY|nr:TrmB family transcriptional regulator [Natranaeroarchaeum aerophilus]MCL9814557.1 TrmB family transcriptional regulator [Natranaeroarchaeum aerophilus]